MFLLLLWQMSRFGSRALRRWDDEDESDVDDLLIIAGLLEGSKRNKRKKKFRGSLPVATTCQGTFWEVTSASTWTTLLTSVYTMRNISEGGFGCTSLSFYG